MLAWLAAELMELREVQGERINETGWNEEIDWLEELEFFFDKKILNKLNS